MSFKTSKILQFSYNLSIKIYNPELKVIPHTLLYTKNRQHNMHKLAANKVKYGQQKIIQIITYFANLKSTF